MNLASDDRRCLTESRIPNLLVVLLLLLYTAMAVAAEPDAAPLSEPVALVAVAGVDRILEDFDHLCAIGDLQHLSQLVHTGLEGLNGLAGLNRELPGGAMIFLDPAHPEAEPIPLAFFPVDDIPALQQTASRLGLTIEQPAGSNDFTILLGGVRHPLKISDGYARVTKPGMPRSTCRQHKFAS